MRIVHPVVLHPSGHPFLTEAARGVNVVEGEAVGLLQRHHIGNGFVHDLGALRAKGGDHHLTGKAQSLTGLFSGGEQELLAHRHSNDLHPFRVLIVLDAFFKSHQHPGGPAGCQLGGHAGNRVALVDTGGDVHRLGGVQCREAGVAAGADNRVGLKVPDDFPALAHRAQNALHGVDILFQARQIQLPAQAGAGQAFHLVASLRH